MSHVVMSNALPGKEVSDEESATNVSRVEISLSPLSPPELSLSGNKLKKRRFTDEDRFFITLYNHNESELETVGLQLWKGALLLTDYLIHRKSNLEDKVVLEMGGGVGLCGVILTLMRHKGAYITEKDQSIARFTAKNLATNLHSRSSNHLLGPGEENYSEVKVRLLDWKSTSNPRCFSLSNPPSPQMPTDWTVEDCSLVQNNEVLFIAADVIYDDELIVAFFKKLSEMMRPLEKLILTIEKRINFDASKLAIVANGYTLFQEHLNNDDACFIGTLVSIEDIPQYVRGYERDQYMELWEIEPRT